MRLTWADLYFTGMVNYLNYMSQQDILKDHENLRKVFDDTSELPGVKEWMETRPFSEE
jgi:glutathione S-transferase